MKYSEFEVEIREMEFEVDNSYDSYLFIENSDGNNILSISKTSMYALSTSYYPFEDLEGHVKKRLFNLAVELASTPLDEREEEQKYYVELIEDAYLVRYPNSGNFGMSSLKEVSQGTTQFTEKEIKDYDERFWAFAVLVGEENNESN